MRIERVRIHQFAVPLHEPFVTALKPIPELERVLVEIETDTGIVGLGEGAPAYEVTGETQRSTAAVLTDVLAPLLVGECPLDLERLREAMWSLVDGAPTAHAAVETALQDIRGKVADMPLYRLLGGDGSEPTLSAPKVLSIKPPAEMAEDAATAVDRGYDQIKIKLGEDPETDAERVRRIDSAVPDEVSLKTDANQGWGDTKTALAAIRGIEDRVDVVEQPVDKDRLDDLERLRRRTDVKIMPDESVESPSDVLELIERGAGDMYNIKLMKTGGIAEAIRLDAIADAAGRPTQIGSMVEGHVGTAAGVHFALARGNVVWNEMVGPFMTETGVGDLETDRPTVTVDGPGLGVSVDRNALADLRTSRTEVTDE